MTGAASTIAAPIGRAAPARPTRLFFALGLAVLAGALVWNLAGLGRLYVAAIGYPYSLDYGEGIVWQQMRAIVRGDGYAPLGIVPGIVFHYPPGYHLLTAAVAALGLDPLVAGRLVAMAATLGMAVLTGRLALLAIGSSVAPGPARMASALAGLVLAGCYPVGMWGAVMRVDMLATALGLAGLLLAIRATARPRLIHAAAAAFVAALFTKQTSVAAPAAAFLVLLAIRPRLALQGIATAMLLGLTMLAVLVWMTDGGFLRHTVLYNVNRIEPARLLLLGAPLALNFALVALGTIGAAAAWRRMRASDGGRAATAILLAFLAIKTAMLPLAMKSGSNDNYVIEWLCALAVFAAVAIAPGIAFVARGHDAVPPRALLTGVLLGLALPLQLVVASTWDFAPGAMAARAAALDDVVARIRASDRPVIADDMTLPIRAGRDVVLEPAIVAELAHAGRYDEAGLVRLLRARSFGFVATQGVRGETVFDERYNPAVADAIDTAYPRKEAAAGLILHLPAR